MILFERHFANCNCSYCAGGNALHYGLNIPQRWKDWNAWYVLKVWSRTYIRWTNTWLRCFARSRA